MKTVSWTWFDVATIVVVSVMMLVIAGLSVKFKERGRVHVAGHGSEWKCYPQPANRGQPACFAVADARRPIAVDKVASLKLSGVSLALR